MRTSEGVSKMTGIRLRSYPLCFFLAMSGLLFLACQLSSPPSPTSTVIPPLKTQSTPAPPPPALTETVIPLREEGPWLLLQKPDHSHGTSDFTLCNWDGTGCVSSKETIPFTYSTISGKYLAGLDQTRNQIPQVMILELPSFRIVRKIPVITEQIQNDIVKTPNPNASETADQSVVKEQSLDWSPDRRYLAFIAALDQANTDLYVYDLQADAIQRVTTEPESVSLMGWSPDSQSLVYFSANYYSTMAWASIKNAYYVNITDKKVIKLYDYPQNQENKLGRFYENIAGWTSSHTFIVLTAVNQDAPRFIREVDIQTTTIRTLYPGFFLGLGLDAASQTIYLNIGKLNNSNKNPDHEDGIYLLDIKSGHLELLMKGRWQIYWSYALESLIVTPEGTQENNITLINDQGIDENRYKGRITPSPNGQWIINQTGARINLYNRKGDLVETGLSPGTTVFWLRDSSGFYIFNPLGDLYLYLQKGNSWKMYQIADGLTSVPNALIYPFDQVQENNQTSKN